ncbi:MAG: hypothetical protein AAF266_03410 [Planctomycetota bacterium]
MNESRDTSGIEAMLAAAGDYVGPSDDLRPRVLEAVTKQQKRRLRRRRMSVAAGGTLIVTLFVGLQAATLGDRLDGKSTSQRVARLVEADAEEPYRSGVEEICWRLVDAVMTVRSEQAGAFGGDNRPAKPAVSDASDGLAAQDEGPAASF